MSKPHLLIMALLGIGACTASAASTPTEITPFTYDASVSDVTPTLLTSNCRVNVVHVADHRFRKDGIGAEFPVVTGPSEPWLNSGLERLKEYGFKVQRSDKPLPDAINLNVRLIRAYTWYGQMRINGMVAFDVEVATPAGPRSEKFRSTGSKTNMWNGKGEHVTALNYAFNHAMHKMAQSLKQDCAQVKVAAL